MPAQGVSIGDAKAGGSRLRTALVALGIFAAIALGANDSVADHSDPVTVDVSRPIGEINHELLGLDHEARGDEVEDLLRTRVPSLHWMRVDAYLDQPGTVEVETDPFTGLAAPRLDPTAIDARLRSAERSGAEALLIIDYMPPALADPACAERSRQFPGTNRCPPADYEMWKELVRQTVRHACCEANLMGGINRVRWFEVWNEPDLITFFSGSMADYLRIYQATNEALQEVEAEQELDLKIGGGAFLFADPPWIEGLLGLVGTSRSDPDPEVLDLDFLSWHHYANNPFFGPLDGVPFTPDQDNPTLSAASYADQTRFVRELVLPYKASGIDPLLWLDEWNVNAGSDDRHGNAYGAAFTAASLHAMQEAGLDRSARFNTQDNADSPFHTWGMFTFTGAPKPVFHTFQMWSLMEPRQIEVRGLPSNDPPVAERFEFGVLAGAATDSSPITILAYNFAPYRQARARILRPSVVGLAGDVYRETVYLVDDAHVGVGDDRLVRIRGPRRVSLPGALEDLELPPNSVALIVLRR